MAARCAWLKLAQNPSGEFWPDGLPNNLGVFLYPSVKLLSRRFILFKWQ